MKKTEKARKRERGKKKITKFICSKHQDLCLCPHEVHSLCVVKSAKLPSCLEGDGVGAIQDVLLEADRSVRPYHPEGARSHLKADHQSITAV